MTMTVNDRESKPTDLHQMSAAIIYTYNHNLLSLLSLKAEKQSFVQTTAGK